LLRLSTTARGGSGALVHPDYPVLRALRGLPVSYSLPPVAIPLISRAG
jgi:hypothetical protein